MLKFFKIILILCLVGLIAAYFGFKKAEKDFFNWNEAALNLKAPVILEYPRGTSLKALSDKLEQQQLVSKAFLFEWWVRLFDDYSRFQAGRYRFEKRVSPKDIIKALRGGDTYAPIVYKLTIPEGFTVAKVAARLKADGIKAADKLLAAMHDEKLLKELNIPSTSLEGYLYPATYHFEQMPDAFLILKQAVETFWRRLPEDYVARVGKLGFSLNEAVTFASLIELETRLSDEKPLVSEVIWRRLKRKVALAIDASIIYGIKDFDGNLRWKHLKDKTNPYNTRVHRGLPPTPIGSPALDSLLAVLSPSDKGYFYYVLDLKDGSRHHFSKTLKEHNRYVHELKKERRRQRLQR